MFKVVAGLIEKDGKYLIAKRGYGDLINKWEFPGGKPEENESEEAALERELKEELNIETKTKSHVINNIHIYPNKKIYLKLYEVEYISGEIKLEAHNDYKWVSKEEMLEYDFAPADIPFVKYLNGRLKIEYWDVYDVNRKKLDKFCRRDIDWLEEGEYHIVVTSVIVNSKKEILITRRAAGKKTYPLLWEITSGSVCRGEDSFVGIQREISEETGLNVENSKYKLFKTVYSLENRDIKDIWIFKVDAKIEELHLQEEEVADAKWVTQDEFWKMVENNEVVPNLDFDKDELATFLNINNI